MAEWQLSLTSEEHECLVELLERSLKDARIEEHRTRTPSYREYVLRQENLLTAVLSKLGQPAT